MVHLFHNLHHRESLRKKDFFLDEIIQIYILIIVNDYHSLMTMRRNLKSYELLIQIYTKINKNFFKQQKKTNLLI